MYPEEMEVDIETLRAEIILLRIRLGMVQTELPETIEELKEYQRILGIKRDGILLNPPSFKGNPNFSEDSRPVQLAQEK